MQLLGQVPTDNEWKGTSILSLVWLQEHFSPVPEETGDVIKCQHARAYMLYLLDSMLFADKRGDVVHLNYLTLLGDLQAAGRLS